MNPEAHATTAEPGPASARGPDAPAHDSVVLALAYHTWADGVGRQRSWSPDRVAHHLSTDAQVRRLLVADPLRSHLARFRLGRAPFDVDFPADSSRVLVRPRRWRRRDAGDLTSTVAAYRRLDQWLLRASDAHGLGPSVLVSCHPVLAAVADQDRWADVVYYGWDDWLSYWRLRHARELMTWSYRQMAERQVRVIGVTEAIVDRIGSPRSAVVPNGISAVDHESPAPPPAWFAELTGPVALYAGTMQERVDVGALVRCAVDLPAWTFVLVGPLQDALLFAELSRLPNVHIRPSEPRAAVLSMMAAAQVCLVPHRRTPMTEAMSPLKLYEYLASGAVVVATDLPPLRGVSERVLLVEPGAAWAPAVLAAARVPAASAGELASIRAEHDWSQRYRTWRDAALSG